MPNNIDPIFNCLPVNYVFNIIQGFNKNKITYGEADKIIYLLSEQLKYQIERFCNQLNNADNIVVHYYLQT